MSCFRSACSGFLAASALFTWQNAAFAQGSPPNPYGAPPPSGLQAGGLAPPGAGAPAAQPGYDPNATSYQPNSTEAETKDSGRGLEFVWLNTEAGYEIVGLQTFSKKNLVDAGFTETHQQGFMFGVGMGVRLIFLTLGPRFRLGTFSKWQMWSANLEAGMHLPLGRIEPYFTFGGGYSSIGAFKATTDGMDMSGGDVHIRGWNVRLGFGMDYYVTNVVTIGANLTGDGLFLKRPKQNHAPQVPCAVGQDCSAAQEKLDAVYKNDGTSVGAGMAATFVVGLHF